MTDLETRLRDAFAARADLVTPESLRRDPMPSGRARRLPRWAGPTLAGLAVAATAAGVLVAAGPDRSSQGQPADRGPTVSQTRPDGTRVRAAGWTAVVPAGWTVTDGIMVGRRQTACLGTTSESCAIVLARSADPATMQATVPGANVFNFGDVTCRVVKAPRPTERPGVDAVEFDCGEAPETQRVYQLVAVKAGLMALAAPATGPIPREVLDRLQVDRDAAPMDTSKTVWQLGPVALTLPAPWSKVEDPETGNELLCPPGTVEGCRTSGGLLVRHTETWEAKGGRTDPTVASGYTGIPRPMRDMFLSCGGAARTPAASYRVTVDRPVTVAGAQGRYVEATFTCPDGSSRQMRRWHLPSLQVLIDSAGRNPDVDEAVRTVRSDR